MNWIKKNKTTLLIAVLLGVLAATLAICTTASGAEPAKITALSCGNGQTVPITASFESQGYIYELVVLSTVENADRKTLNSDYRVVRHSNVPGTASYIATAYVPIPVTAQADFQARGGICVMSVATRDMWVGSELIIRDTWRAEIQPVK